VLFITRMVSVNVEANSYGYCACAFSPLVVSEHDRMLADLGRGVGRLKTQSVMINEETSLHVRLLDDMEGDAERASSGLQTEARHAQKVTQVFTLLFHEHASVVFSYIR